MCSCGKPLIQSQKSKRVKKCTRCNIAVGNATRVCHCGFVLLGGTKAGGAKQCPDCQVLVGNAKRICDCGHVFISGEYTGKPKGKCCTVRCRQMCALQAVHMWQLHFLIFFQKATASVEYECHSCVVQFCTFQRFE